MNNQERLEKDLKEIEEMKNVKLAFPEEGDKTQFIVSVKVNEGLYRNKYLKFKFTLDDDWPNTPPKIVAVDKIWHPNIGCYSENTNAFVDFATLGTSYKASIPLSHFVFEIKYLLINFNPDDAMNIEAAHQYKFNHEEFKERVKEYMDNIDDGYEEDDD